MKTKTKLKNDLELRLLPQDERHLVSAIIAVINEHNPEPELILNALVTAIVTVMAQCLSPANRRDFAKHLKGSWLLEASNKDAALEASGSESVQCH